MQGEMRAKEVVPTKEIPFETLLGRANCLPFRNKDTNYRILAYLPRVYSVTFTNCGRTAASLRCLGVLMDQPVNVIHRAKGPRSTLDLYFDLRQATTAVWSFPPIRYSLPYDICCAKLAHGICRQILSIIGISSDSNVRLLRLLGEGPWKEDSNTIVLRDVMQIAFNVLLGVASCLPDREREGFLRDLSCVNGAWSSNDPTQDGLHDWQSLYWQSRIRFCRKLPSQTYTMIDISSDVFGEWLLRFLRLNLHGEGTCEFRREDGTRAACGAPCKLCFCGRHTIRRHICSCSFHIDQMYPD